MQVSLGLPWGDRWEDGSPVSGSDLVKLARAAEASGFSAVFATDHPAPPRRWLDVGGHPTLDPFVALSFVASATSSLLVHTNLFVAVYRHPLLAAKAVSSLSILAEGRVILGVGAGYLKPEFAALGVEFEQRNDLLDQSIVIIRQALAGEEVDGSVIRPLSPSAPVPPIWVGGNSRRAIERAVTLGDGWCPMPSPAAAAGSLRTPAIANRAALAERIAYARERCSSTGRVEPLTICFTPTWGAMPATAMPASAEALDDLAALGELGISWVTLALPGGSVDSLAGNIERFGREVCARVPHPLPQYPRTSVGSHHISPSTAIERS